ncbi:hypothetical protein GC098_31460 [Paenibacillus sp. LMG 31458]|uniref:VOC domain-containing protein n=1 Tax=Paenibacillus phytorum TaxID=2654977 RepID=A0ABX1Y4Y9_9BACL|nr:hypothetical protein [Paenibacillus phytorum]NOU75821.1 hypothetical protein [Paenibacillus phytorum]
MITHFARLQLNTVSVQGVKQYYHDLLCFPIIYESDNEIRFLPTEYFILGFKETADPIAPAHFAFEVPYSEFENVVKWFDKERIPLLKWPDGRIVDAFETGKNVYFRDGDGNLLEIITHFAIGGTAHAVIPSKKRKWIPISMSALTPTMNVSFGVTNSIFIEEVKTCLQEEDIFYESNGDGELHFKINEYNFDLCMTNFPEEVPSLLNLPYSRL